jgi:hypothetical protein
MMLCLRKREEGGGRREEGGGRRGERGDGRGERREVNWSINKSVN